MVRYRAAVSTFEATTVLRFDRITPKNTNVLAVGLGWDDSVLVASRSSDESLRRIGKGGVSSPKIQHDEPTSLHVTRWAQGQVRRVVCHDQRLIPHHIQPLQDGVLLANSRCRWRKEGAEHNALICDWSGEVHRTLTLGDGIAHVRTTPDDMIWVSFFDEGVFGNYGWGGPGPAPIGECGLIRFDAAGQPNLRYDAERAGTDTICDAYATTTDRAGNAWVSFYTEFPLVRVSPDGSYSSWPLGQQGASALAIDGNRVLVAGGYDVRNRAVMLQLGEAGECRRISKGTISTEDGTPLDRATFVGADSCMYAIQDDTLYAVKSW